MSARTKAMLASAVVFVLARSLWLAALLVVTRDGRPRSAYAILTRWDGQWYARIASSGYGHYQVAADGSHHYDYAFFPLLPLIERAGHALTGLAPVDVGLVVSWTAGTVAAAGICALGSELHSPRVGLVTAALWSLLPMSAVLALSYSDTLLIALAAWSLLALVRGEWLIAGLLAAAAGFARPTGAAIVLTVFVAGLLRASRQQWRPLLAAVLAPTGLVGYLAWVGTQTGSINGYFEVTDGWHNGFDGGLSFVRWVADLGPIAVAVVAGIIVLITLWLLLIRDHEPWPVIFYSAVIVAIALTTSGFFGSKPRYLLAGFPLLLPLATRLTRLPRPLVAGVLVALGVIGTAYGVVWLTGTGPP
ncbi:hypothetical protein [Branchiibius cervicis]|uniref:Glycosyltransferase RgtA/B/C/D-like domain-containing protein n=1 Tax=Branchiibius cervicis TaxID=908252 RepID=A0ABW2AUD2_9MICO